MSEYGDVRRSTGLLPGVPSEPRRGLDELRKMAAKVRTEGVDDTPERKTVMTDQSEHQGTGPHIEGVEGYAQGTGVGEGGESPGLYPGHSRVQAARNPYLGRRPYPIPPGFPGGCPIPTPARRQELLAFAQGIVAGADGQVTPDEMPLVFQFVTLLLGE